MRLIWYVQRKVEGRRGLSLRATQERLHNELRDLVIAENAMERLRRAANVTNWVLQGLVTTPALAKRVASYEVRREGQGEQVAAARRCCLTRRAASRHQRGNCSILIEPASFAAGAWAFRRGGSLAGHCGGVFRSRQGRADAHRKRSHAPQSPRRAGEPLL